MYTPTSIIGSLGVLPESAGIVTSSYENIGLTIFGRLLCVVCASYPGVHHTGVSLSCRNHAIADYLQSHGYGQTLECFKKEAEMVSNFLAFVLCYSPFVVFIPLLVYVHTIACVVFISLLSCVIHFLCVEGLWKCQIQWIVRKKVDFSYSIAKEGTSC